MLKLEGKCTFFWLLFIYCPACCNNPNADIEVHALFFSSTNIDMKSVFMLSTITQVLCPYHQKISGFLPKYPDVLFSLQSRTKHQASDAPLDKILRGTDASSRYPSLYHPHLQLLSGVLFNPNTEPDLSDLEPIVQGFPWGTFPSQH